MYASLLLALVICCISNSSADLKDRQRKRLRIIPKLKRSSMDQSDMVEELDAQMQYVLHLQDQLKMVPDYKFPNVDTNIGIREVCCEKYLVAMDRYFDVFDSDGNGLIHYNEFENTFAELSRKQYTLQKTIGVQLSRHQLPMFLTADRNVDGSLDRKEFRAFIAPFCYKLMYKSIIVQLLQYDGNGDNAISKDELIKGLLVHLLTDLNKSQEFWLNIMKAFNHFDHNKNKQLEGREIFEFLLATYININLPSPMLKNLLEMSDLYDYEEEYDLNDEDSVINMVHEFEREDYDDEDDEVDEANEEETRSFIYTPPTHHVEL